DVRERIGTVPLQAVSAVHPDTRPEQRLLLQADGVRQHDRVHLLEALPEMVDPDGRAENGFGEHAVGNDPAADIPPGRQQVTLRLVLLRAVRVRTHDGNRAATVALDRRIRYPAIDDIHPRLGEGAVERPLEPPPG